MIFDSLCRISERQTRPDRRKVIQVRVWTGGFGICCPGFCTRLRGGLAVSACVCVRCGIEFVAWRPVVNSQEHAPSGFPVATAGRFQAGSELCLSELG
jgi:hypothetical protein